MAGGYANGILMGILRPGLNGWTTTTAPGVAAIVGAAQVGTKLPAGYVKNLPFVHARSTPGGTRKGPRLDVSFSSPVQIDCYHVDSRPASELAEHVLWLLNNAWATQQVTSDGHLGRMSNVVPPYEFLESQRLDGVSRWVLSLAATVCPPS